MVNMKQMAALACGVALGAFASGQAQAELFTLYDSSDPGTAIGTFASIDTAGSGASHYDYFSASGHPIGIDLGPTKANIWIHENTLTGEYSFGFIFGKEIGGPISAPTLSFRVVGSDTAVFIAVSDDASENQEVAPGVFVGDYLYRNNTDGILVGGITGTDWMIIIDAVGWDVIDSWQAASGDGNHLDLQLDSLYQISLYDGEPNGTNDINGGGQGIAEPAAIALLGAGLMGLGIFGRRRRKD